MNAATPAERMLMDLGISEPKEIDLDAIAWTKGAVVNYRPMDGCEATIVGSKRRAVISVNSRSMPERRRFSLAHELGHWHHHRGRVLFCGKNDVCNFENDALNPERQADDFASDLILPPFMVEVSTAQNEETHAGRSARTSGRVFRKPYGHTCKNDSVEPLPHGHRLPQQDEAALVRALQDDSELVVSLKNHRSADLRGRHAVQWSGPTGPSTAHAG